MSTETIRPSMTADEAIAFAHALLENAVLVKASDNPDAYTYLPVPDYRPSAPHAVRIRIGK